MARARGRESVYCLELGGEDDDFAACEARSAAGGVEVVGGGVAVAGHVDLKRARGLAYTHRVSELVGRTDASVESARTLLRAASLDRDPDGTVAVRARDVRGATGVSTSRAERELGQVLVDRGFSVDLDDPDDELRVLFAGPVDDRAGERGESRQRSGGGEGVCLVGWLAGTSVRDFGDRRPTDRPFFQPGSMAPLDARAFANVAGAGPGATILDPMCGTGGVLVEAGLVGARTVGVDAQRKMVRGARENLAAYLADAPPFDVIRGDATALPIRDDAVDAVVFDAPYGRQSKVARHSLETLVAGALSEAHRVAPRAVVVADRPWRTEARDAGWRLTDLFERRVHRSLVRYVHVLERA
ncbi:MAG: methyltransferase domain-containing protein [Haloferacaceae archaeon]